MNFSRHKKRTLLTNMFQRYKVLWKWLQTVFYSDELPRGYAMIAVPRVNNPAVEDVYIFDSSGLMWRSMNSMSLHLENMATNLTCSCEACGRMNKCSKKNPDLPTRTPEGDISEDSGVGSPDSCSPTWSCTISWQRTPEKYTVLLRHQ